LCDFGCVLPTPGFTKIREVSFGVGNLFFNTLAQIALGCVWKVRVAMSAVVMEFRPKDRIRQDAEPIALIYRSMGTQAAEEVVNRALTELAMTMSALAAQVRGKNLLDVARQLRRLERMAQQLGLVSLGNVAADVRGCLEVGDLTAFAAVWARLIRVAETSLATEKGALDQQV
jgi:hypothetical protein